MSDTCETAKGVARASTELQQIQNFDIVNLAAFHISRIKDRDILIIDSLKKISSDYAYTIGQPVDYVSILPPVSAPSAPTPQSHAPPVYRPISSLSLYSTDWTIKVRLTKKGEIKTYKNQRGSGHILPLELLDEDGTQIIAALFNQSIDQYYETLHEGKVYLISNGSVKLSPKKYTSIVNDYSIVLDSASSIVPAEDDGKIKPQVFSYVPIGGIKDLPSGSVIDVIGVIKTISSPVEFATKEGSKSPMRSIRVFDDSGAEIEIMMWKSFAVESLQEGQVVAIKNVRVGQFNGKQLSTLDQSIVYSHVSHERARFLEDWVKKQQPDLTKLVPLTLEKHPGERIMVPKHENMYVERGRICGVDSGEEGHKREGDVLHSAGAGADHHVRERVLLRRVRRVRAEAGGQGQPLCPLQPHLRQMQIRIHGQH